MWMKVNVPVIDQWTCCFSFQPNTTKLNKFLFVVFSLYLKICDLIKPIRPERIKQQPHTVVSVYCCHVTLMFEWTYLFALLTAALFLSGPVGTSHTSIKELNDFVSFGEFKALILGRLGMFLRCLYAVIRTYHESCSD